MTQVQDILARHQAMAQTRDQWRPLWQELADILHPERGGFTTALQVGREAQHEIYDSTPMQARRGLATAIDGMLKPASAKWFWLKCADDDLNEDDEVKTWLDAVQRAMWGAIYNPAARFIQHGGAVDNDLATFGLGYLWISENRNRNGLLFRSLHIGDCAIDENADGQIDTIAITRRWTARQFVQRFGIDKAPPKVKEALEGPNAAANSGKLFEFVQMIQPREDYDPRRADEHGKPFVNCIVSCEDETKVDESAFHEFPLAIPRWEVAANQIYPRSPGMMALPDARTLQAMGHTILVGGQRAVDPPVWVASEGVMSAVRTFPGGLTVIDVEAIKATGGKPIGHMEMGSNLPIGREMQDDYRRMVEAAFFKNVFNLPVDGPDMTAYEVAERKEEFIRTIGPTLGQLEPDYIGVTVERVFNIMMRASATADGRPLPGAPFPPAPEVLAGRDVKFEFASPIQKARKQLELAGAGQMFAFLSPLAQAQPDILDNLDGDEITRDMPDTFGTPHKWLRPKEKVEALRAQRAQQMAGQGAIAEGQGIADIVKTVADAGSTVAGMTGQPGG
jgi:hypothetical protein